MSLADTSQVVVRYAPEVTWGVVPTAALTELRVTGESMKVNKQTTQSQEIRNDRQITDVITTSVDADGGINGEFSYAAYDDFLEAAMYGTWGTTAYTSSSIAIVGKTVFLPVGHGQHFTAGDVIVMAGWTASGNNTSFTVATVGSTYLTFTAALTDEAAGNTITLTRAYTGGVGAISIASDVVTLPGGHGQHYNVGDVVVMSGWANSANNISIVVSAVGTNTITTLTTLIDDSAADTVTLTRTYSGVISAYNENVVTLPNAHGQTLYVGQKFKMAGWSTTADNGVFTISALTTNAFVSTEALTNDAGGEAVTISSKVLRNGTTRKSFVIEKNFGDVGKFIAFLGMVIQQMNLTVTAQSKITCTFSFLGKTGQTGSATVGTGAAIAAPANAIMNAGENVGSVSEAGTVISVIKSITFDANNNLRGKAEVGVIGNGEIGSGRLAVTGNIEMYFADFTIYDKYIASTASSLRVTLSDANGKYDIYLPRVKFTKADIVAGGPDQDVMVAGTYQALRDPTTGVTVMITKI